MGSSETLRAVIDAGRTSKRLDELSSARVIGKVARLAHAAQQKAGAGKAIGPITPARVSLSETGEVSLVEGTGSVLGYSAPEQVSGGSGDRRSDVFSLGTVLYEALTHQRLFDAMNDAAVKVAVQERAITPPAEVNANIPAELSAICMRALSRNPADRYQSLKSMAVEIEEFLEEAGYTDDDSRIAQFLAGLPRKGASASTAPPTKSPTQPPPATLTPPAAAKTTPMAPTALASLAAQTTPTAAETAPIGKAALDSLTAKATPTTPVASSSPSPAVGTTPPLPAPQPSGSVAPIPSMPRPGASQPPPASTPAAPSILTDAPRAKSNSGAALAAALANANGNGASAAAKSGSLTMGWDAVADPTESSLPAASASSTAVGVPAAPVASEWQDKTPKPHASPVAAVPAPDSGTPAASTAASGPVVAAAPVPLTPLPPILPSGSQSALRNDKSTLLVSVPPQVKVSTTIEAKHVEAKTEAKTETKTDAKPAAVIVEDKPKAVIVDDAVEARAQAALDEEAKTEAEGTPLADSKGSDAAATKPEIKAAKDAKRDPAVDAKHETAKPDDTRSTLVDSTPPALLNAAEDAKAANTEASTDDKATVSTRAKKDTGSKRTKKETGPHPASVVSLPGRDSKGDLLAGWGWGTDKHDAIAPAGYSAADDDELDAPNSKKTLTYVIGGGFAVALLIVIIAFAAGGKSKDPKVSAKEKEKQAAIEKAKAESAAAARKAAEEKAAAEAAAAEQPTPVETGSAQGSAVDPAAAQAAADEKAAADKAAADEAAAKAAAEQAKLDAEAAKKAEADAKKAAAEQAKLDAESAKKAAADAKKAEAEAKKAAEAQRKADEAANKAEAKRIAQEEAAKKKAEADAKRAEDAAKKAEARRIAQEEAANKKAEADAKRAEAAKTAAANPKTTTAKTDKRPDTKTTTTTKTVAAADTKPKGEPVNPETAYRQGLQLFARGDTSGALSALRTSLAANPNYAPTWRGLGLVFEKMGEKDQAKAAYKRYLQLAPSAGDAEIIKGRLERLGS